MSQPASTTILIGLLGKDPEVRQVGESLVANFSVATDHNKKVNGEWEKETEWHNVTAWNEQAEFARDKFGKGCKVIVIGRLRTRSYKNKDGDTKTSLEIVADVVGLTPKPARKEDRGASRSSGSSRQSSRQGPIDDSDIPF